MSALTRGAVSSAALSNPNSAFTGSQNVGTAAATLLDTNANRQFLMVQNSSSAGTIAFTIDGTTPVVNGAGSITLTTTQAVMFDIFVPTGQVKAIAAGAGTAVTTIEG